ncbi:SgcJ/EcaC family oxidoreductase [Sphingomonas sp.]|uniref:YybH family protein n=1 Tax=Sphingomonas sp. TaxID=28214 RepID=UPI001B19F825|nr:SgcJ/EcaC family oxidoreductase [Sphingomonas sp.]MBO9712848.1 SgcJ/EcaC family oxidoreductase [Sphingomonas sp.]
MIRAMLAMLALLLAVPEAMARPADDPRAAVEAAMADSAEGWNSGDIDRFLAVYSDDPATSFTGKIVTRGKEEIRNRYMVTYARQFGHMAAAVPTRLSFRIEDFRMLGPDHALLIAQWTLENIETDKPDTGMTSLVFRKEAGGWKIIADHSS